jgi:hypothetical protein
LISLLSIDLSIAAASVDDDGMIDLVAAVG